MTQTAQLPRYFEVEGEVKFFDPKKRLGYVKPDDQTLGDMLLPIRCLEEHGRKDVEQGTRLRCKAERRRRDNKISVKTILAFGT